MPPMSLWARFTRGQDISWVVRNHGFFGTVRWLRRSVSYHLWLHITPAGRRERDFDVIHGVETEGIVPRWEMGDVGPNLRHAVQYQPTKPRKFLFLLNSLNIQHSEYTFVDIGSGKGRTLLLARQYGFSRLVGVEFVSKLCEIARKNLATANCPSEILCMDATQYTFPNEPLVIYMFNPFGIKPMRELARNLELSLSQFPRDAYVIYWNALYPEVFAESSWFLTIAARRNEFAIFKSVLKCRSSI
jgi:Methyltransferase domain